MWQDEGVDQAVESGQQEDDDPLDHVGELDHVRHTQQDDHHEEDEVRGIITGGSTGIQRHGRGRFEITEKLQQKGVPISHKRTPFHLLKKTNSLHI